MLDEHVTSESIQEKIAKIDVLKRKLRLARGGKPGRKRPGKPAGMSVEAWIAQVNAEADARLAALHASLKEPSS